MKKVTLVHGISFYKGINKKKSIRFGYSFYLSAQFGHIFMQIL